MSRSFVHSPAASQTAPRLALGLGLTYMSLLVLMPIAGLLLRSFQLPPGEYLRVLRAPETMAAFRLSFGHAFLAALFNTVTGVPVAWVLARYTFPDKRLLDVWIDLPFALPTAVAGIALCALYGPHGFLGGPLAKLGLKVAYTHWGVFIAMCFVSVPFVIRTVQPALLNLDPSQEEAAACLGASRLYCLRRVILPELLPSILTGFSMAFARDIGEYGSIIFIAGNIPGETEILPLRIVHALECYDFAGASVLAIAMMAASFLLLLLINLLQKRQSA